ncbi:MAG: hypothetical protein WCL18_06875 [bacterium]
MNFRKNVIASPLKRPLFTGYGNDHVVQQPKKSFSLLTLFVVIVCTFVVAFFFFKNLDRIGSWFSSSSIASST